MTSNANKNEEEIGRMESGFNGSDSDSQSKGFGSSSIIVTNAQKVVAELIGTYFIIFAGCGFVAVNKIYDGTVTFPRICVTWRLIVMVMIYTVGHVFGAHFNPAVTIKFPLKEVPLYIVAQLMGSILASCTLALMFNVTAKACFGTLPVGLNGQSLAIEIAISFLLMFVVSGASTDTKAIVQLSRIAVGMTIMLNVFVWPGAKRQRLLDDDDFVSDVPLRRVMERTQRRMGKGRMNSGKGDINYKTDTLVFRRSPEFFVELMKSLNDKQLEAVRDMGFGALIHFGIAEIPGKLTFWLLKNFQKVTCSIRLGSYNKLHIGEEDVQLTLGFPRGDVYIEKKTRQTNIKLLDDIAAECERGKYRMLPSYVQGQMHKDKEGGEWFRKVFLILMESVLIESSADGYIKPKILDFIDDVRDIKRYNWCAYVISKLHQTHEAWISRQRSTYTGPIIFLLVSNLIL